MVPWKKDALISSHPCHCVVEMLPVKSVRSDSGFLIGWEVQLPFTVIAAIAIWTSKKDILFEKLPLDLVCLRACMCVYVCLQMGGKCNGKMGAVSQPNETNLLGAHTHTHAHRAPLGQWKCHIIGFPFQDNRHAHWIKSDHQRQFPSCLPLCAFYSLLHFFLFFLNTFSHLFLFNSERLSAWISFCHSSYLSISFEISTCGVINISSFSSSKNIP